QLAAIKKYVINPVEAREAALEKPETLVTEYDKPTTVATLNGFTDKSRSELETMISELGLAMDSDDIVFCREYFLSEHRDPTITELRMIDTYWSDHCRHTTFTTAIDNVSFEDKQLEDAYNHYLEVRKELGVKKPVCLMDIATVSVKYLKKAGLLDKLDESEEINACTVKLDVDVDGVTEPWLLLFKNETHNHPTEIEPFGGAATCIGGAIRDPLSGRSYVYGAMRVTGAADPLKPISETIPGKLSQRKLVTGAAAGYSSYGNQIGLATGIVDELYHPGYAAKRMEIGAVIAAAPAENVRRERPAPGDVVILLGGSTGRDGIGGATGSSKAHNTDSVKTCGAEVQKGNAPEERKLQRLFRNPVASKLIKRCNDFGAGGVSVAIGELADGLEIDLNAVPKKYEGLDGTELAISESQERMAVVVEAADEEKFLSLAAEENLQAVRVAVVQEDPRLVMNWNGRKIVDISREFLNSNGAAKHITIETSKPETADDTVSALAGKSGGLSFEDKYMTLVSDLNSCSMRGLSERFDSTIGAGTVIMPFGGARQLSPSQAMVQKIPVEKKHTDTCSVMSWGYNPFITEKNCFRGAYLAVVESVAKLIASGAEFKDVYLTFQEYFAKPGHDPKRWGQPLSALLGAFEAQLALGIGAIGGKDSMSGTFEKLDVPPTLVSFAVTSSKTENIVTDDFKKSGHAVVRIAPVYTESGLPETASLKACFALVTKLARGGKLEACYTPGIGGIAEAVFKMGIGNGIGFEYTDKNAQDKLFSYDYGAFIAELSDGIGIDEVKAEAESIGSDVIAELLGNTTAQESITLGGESISMESLLKAYEDKLESVYSCNIPAREQPMKTFTYKNEAQTKTAAPAFKCAKPKVLIPAFPGTNCEFDSAKAAADAGCDPEIIVIRNLTGDAISGSIDEFAKKLKDAQMIFIPGGFSGGDEPDGSGKFITAFFRNEAIKEGVTELLEKRDGLMCGICNGFQALIKLG
ncbi:MAG: phosphoribosylformylglycinamidine synthase, partial [Lachnospiraceae bacterium]|nr:phosphoribosylformylglycinamidine synthase [Lachnospiraceae bacterium]